jgi:hypothetical protein
MRKEQESWRGDCIQGEEKQIAKENRETTAVADFSSCTGLTPSQQAICCFLWITGVWFSVEERKSSLLSRKGRNRADHTVVAVPFPTQAVHFRSRRFLWPYSCWFKQAAGVTL